MGQLTRKIFIAFCLISIIPFLVFAYLILPHLLPTATYVSSIATIVFITCVIVVLGFSLLIGISRNVAKLSSSANIISEGDLTHSVQIKADNEVIGLASSLNKITQRLREDINDLETNAILVERANKELDRLNKLKSEFVSMVSHELRAPLINIKQAAFLLLNTMRGQIDEEQERSLAIVNRSAERLLKLISDLLDISKIEAGELKLDRQMVNIDKIIREAAESLERWAEVKKIGLKLEIESNLPEIYVDPDRINQVLVNLLSNAIKFTPVNGQIIVNAEMEREGDFLEISVTDTGLGIPPEQRDEVFERFKQVDGSSWVHMQGIGLGLSITREIVRMHGGNIWVESKQGQGSRFTFTLPKYSAEKILIQNMDNRIATASKKNKEFSIFIIRLDNYLEITKESEEVAQRVFLNMLETLKNVIKVGEFVPIRSRNEIFILADVGRQGELEMKERLKRAIKESTLGVGKESEINFSYGSSTYPDDADNVKDLLKEAQKSFVSEREERLRKNIMVVDDELTVVESLKKLLVKFGYSNLTEAYDGFEALQRLRTLTPDLIILDMKMPKMNGYEVINRLREDVKTKNISILIISGYEVETDDLKEHPVIPIISKPVDVEQFKSLVNYLL